jgi:hypothetical protein
VWFKFTVYLGVATDCRAPRDWSGHAVRDAVEILLGHIWQSGVSATRLIVLMTTFSQSR